MQLIVNITVLAAIYALLACGYVLIYRVSRVLNMAHGEIAMLGAYLLYTTASLFVGNPFTAIAAAVVLSLMVGVLVYVLLMRKMTGEMVLAAILTTIAIGILLRGLIVLIWSAAQQHPLQALHFSNPSIGLLGGARISACAALHGGDDRRGLWRRCSPSCASGAGACACARPGKTRCWRRSAASTCTRSMRLAWAPLDV